MRRALLWLLDGVLLSASFPVGVFFLEGLFVAALVAFIGVFFLLDGRFLAAIFFFELPVFLTEVFFLLTLLRWVFLLLGRLAVFFDDILRFDAALAVFFTEGFLRDGFFTVVFLPLLRFLAAAFLLGISPASKANLENRRLYRGNGLAEAFSDETRRPAAPSQDTGPFQPGFECSTATVV